MPRLTASIQTCNSAERIAERIGEAQIFADEVIVGVDDSSSDATFEVARELADVTYRFKRPGVAATARLLPFEFASGDWILSLDDDESMEPSFDAIRDELLADEAATHFHFPRKWVVNFSPCEYVRASPWFPDWQLRLFRNNASMVWKPPRAHTGYYVQGRGHYETRASILHFEPLCCGAEARRQKLVRYRATAGAAAQEYYASMEGQARAACALRAQPGQEPGDKRERRVVPEVREPSTVPYPDWRAQLTAAEIPQHSRGGAPIIAEITARNTGKQSWSPPFGRWPLLHLTFHLLDRDGKMIEHEGPRFAMPRMAKPGDAVTFLAAFTTPAEPGEYVLEWDLVSEGECWFRDCGSETLHTPLSVS